MRRLRARFAAIAVLAVTALAATACAPSRPQTALPEIGFAQLGEIPVNVAQIDVVNEYVAPMAVPNVEHFAPTTPVNAVRRWVDHRLRRTGTDGRLRVVILDGRIEEMSLPRTEGVRGLVAQDQTERYNGRIAVRLEAEKGGNAATYETQVERSRTIGEGATLADREKLMHELVQRMMEDLNARLEEGFRSALSSFSTY